MRKDKAKNMAEVAKAIVVNPLLTDREIEEKTGVSKSSVNRALQEMGQVGAKSQDIITITDVDKRIIEKSQIIIEQAIDKHIEISEASGGLSLQEALQASGLAKESTARYTIFRGNATDDQGGLKTIENIDIV